MLFHTVVNVSLADSQYLVDEVDELKEVCVIMQGRSVAEVIVQLSSRNATALCK